jgi:phosphatidylserine decarboxylase
MSRLAVLPQYVYPKQLLTRFAGFVAGNEWGRITTRLIRNFIRDYDVDMNEAVEPDPAAYKTFNAFFTRALKPGARPIAGADLVCPVDGAVSQFGKIAAHRILQAKGHDYTTQALLAADPALAVPFEHGSFATIYLSPRDYHRIHMPCDGKLTRMVHVPGALFSVNPVTAAGVPGLWARNERVVCFFDGAHGPWVLVLVGATIVGSMQTVWHGVVNTERRGQVREWTYEGQDISLKKGEEMGRFLLGSTVILLFPQGDLAFAPSWAPVKPVRLGEAMANRAA